MVKSTSRIIRLGLILLLLLCSAQAAFAQRFAIKTNLLDDALLDVNLGGELKVAPKWSVEAIGSFNAWTLSDGKRWKHWYAQPGVRYWLCDIWDGHFFGAHLHGGQYNLGGIKHLHNFLGTSFSQLADHRYQGWFVGAGISYGYSWILGKHWNLEGEIGFGWAYTRYDKFPCTKCGVKEASNKPHNYVGPTKAAINIVYLF